MFERELRDLAHVPRWGVLRRNRTQNVAEHMYYVALYSIQIAAYLNVSVDRAALMQYALTHDIDELWTGDIPGPAKRTIVNRDALSSLSSARLSEVFPEWELSKPAPGDVDVIKGVVKLADWADAVFYLGDEANSGNRSVGDIDDPNSPLGSVFLNLRGYANNHCPWLGAVKATALVYRVRSAVKAAEGAVSNIYIGDRL